MRRLRNLGCGLGLPENILQPISVRRALLLLSLAVSLALSPIGAVVHAYQHFGSADASHSKHGTNAPCGVCAAFAALNHAACGPRSLALPVEAASSPFDERTEGVVPRFAPHFSARGPPAAL